MVLCDIRTAPSNIMRSRILELSKLGCAVFTRRPVLPLRHVRLLSVNSSFSVLLFPVIPINVTQISLWLNDIAHASFQLLGFGEATVFFPVPQDLEPCRARARAFLLRLSWRRCHHMMDSDDEGAACAGLEGDFGEGCRECAEELLGVLSCCVNRGRPPAVKMERNRGDVRMLPAASIYTECRNGS